MKSAELRRAFAELEYTRRKRELFFWTVTMSITTIVLIAIAASLVVSLIAAGATVHVEHVAVGAGIASTSAGGRQLLKLMRRFRPIA